MHFLERNFGNYVRWVILQFVAKGSRRDARWHGTNVKACSVRMLIVEDAAAMARGLAERLNLPGFAVDLESDGAEAAQTALLEP